jgi:hypothetical protein
LGLDELEEQASLLLQRAMVIVMAFIIKILQCNGSREGMRERRTARNRRTKGKSGKEPERDLRQDL